MSRRPYVKELSETEFRSRYPLLQPTTTEITTRTRPPDDQAPLTTAAPGETAIPVPLDRYSASMLLGDLGVEKSVRLLISAFGRKAVRDAIRSPGAMPILESSWKHEIVWLLVEMRRAAKRETIEEACKWIARHGGIKSDPTSKSLQTAGSIQKAFSDADKALRKANALPQLRSVVQGYLVFWRKSAKSFDTYFRGILSQCVIVPKGSRRPQ